MSFIEETDPNLVEPISLEETKDYLGFPQDSHQEDAFLERLITATRSLFEERLGRIIVRRTLDYKTEEIDGPYILPPYVHSVDAVSYEIYDPQLRDWIVVDTMDYDYDPGDEPVVYAHFPRGARHITIRFNAGFLDVPESIRMAMLDVVKMKNERMIEDPFEIVRPGIQRWAVEHI